MVFFVFYKFSCAAEYRNNMFLKLFETKKNFAIYFINLKGKKNYGR